jgi:hypothetical protein
MYELTRDDKCFEIGGGSVTSFKKYMHVGDTGAPVKIQIKSDESGGPVDLSRADVFFEMWRIESDGTKTLLFERPAEILDAVNGIVQYAFKQDDISQSAMYLCDFRVMFCDVEMSRWEQIVTGDSGETWGWSTYGDGVIIVTSWASSDHVLRSVDNGRTWSQVSLPSPLAITTITYGDGVFMGVLDTGAGATDKAIRSLDGGLTWEMSPLNPSSDYAMSISHGTGVFNVTFWTAGTGARVYYTEDAGVSWHESSGTDGPSTTAFWDLAHSDTGVVAGFRDNGSGVWELVRSVDSGRTFTVDPTVIGNYGTTVYLGDGIFFQSGYHGVLRSEDYGLTWTHYNHPPGAPATPFLVTYGAGILMIGSYYSAAALTNFMYSYDRGITWTIARLPGTGHQGGCCYGNGYFHFPTNDAVHKFLRLPPETIETFPSKNYIDIIVAL